MKYTLTILIITCLLHQGIGQSVISSGGQSGTSNEIHASATIGEAIIGANNNGDSFSNQGFQQPLQSDITAVIELPESIKINITIGPNPANQQLNISIDKPLEGNYLLTDQNGKLVKKIKIQNNQMRQSINVSQMNAGSYFINLLNEKGKQLITIPFIKI
jgi:hypothetical protein